MKQSISKIVSTALFIGLTAFALTSCYETHYYHHNHHHSREWYGRHHQPPPAGVDFNVDVR